MVETGLNRHDLGEAYPRRPTALPDLGAPCWPSAACSPHTGGLLSSSSGQRRHGAAAAPAAPSGDQVLRSPSPLSLRIKLLLVVLFRARRAGHPGGWQRRQSCLRLRRRAGRGRGIPARPAVRMDFLQLHRLRAADPVLLPPRRTPHLGSCADFRRRGDQVPASLLVWLADQEWQAFGRWPPHLKLPRRERTSTTPGAADGLPGSRIRFHRQPRCSASPTALIDKTQYTELVTVVILLRVRAEPDRPAALPAISPRCSKKRKHYGEEDLSHDHPPW